MSEHDKGEDNQDVNLDEEEQDDKFEPKTDDQLRQEVVERYDLDEEVDKNTIDKLTTDKKEEQQRFVKVLKQKQGYREKAKNKGGDDNKQGDGKDKKDEQPPKTNDLSTRDVLDLQSEGYQPSEIVQLEDEAKKLNLSVKQFKDNPMLMAGFKAQRAEKKAQDATPSPATPSFTDGGGKKVPYSKASPEDKQAHFDSVKRRVQQNRR